MSVAPADITAAAHLAAYRVKARQQQPASDALAPRDNQRAPEGDWRVWMLLAGRGFGKTFSLSHWVHAQVASGKRRIALVAPTAADVRDVMVEGASGILTTAPPNARPRYEPSRRRLTWPNGAIATTYSADEPERLRGPQHDAAACDELGSWRRPEAWDMLMFGLRIGDNPQCAVGTTPRTTPLIRGLIGLDTTVITRGTTYDNRDNLAPQFLSDIVRRYEGTRLGRQELLGELLTDVPGALWTLASIDAARVAEHPDLTRVVVAIDPAVSSHEDSDETGIIVAGIGIDAEGYTLADRSCRLSPDGWARRAVAAYHEFSADRIVAEANNGGDMVRLTIQTVDPNVPVTLVHASRGKQVRAEPLAALYEQQRWHHVGTFPELEDQLSSWTPESGQSPDRLDALVWAASSLMPGIASGGLHGSVV